MEGKNENKICQNCNKVFTLDSNDLGFYERMQVLLPTLCPKCRRISRLSWLNDYILYSRECFLCNKKFVSIYSKNAGKEVMCPKCFYGDEFNPEAYGKGYDPSRSFFEQFSELFNSIPKLGVINDDGIGSVNSLYTNDLAFAKNCTMCFTAWKLENCLYSYYINGGKDLCDCHGVYEISEFSYECISIDSVARSKYLYWSMTCTDCVFGYDLRGCTDCFMCFGLRNKQFHFKNEKYSREEYKKILESYKLDSRDGIKKVKEEYADFIKDKPRKFAELRNSVNCTGTDILRGKNTRDSNFAGFSEDSRYVNNGVAFKSCYDCSGGGETELAYECLTPDHSYNSLSTIKSWKNRNVSYSIDCHSSEELFGCVGIRSGRYMIFNKRYEKEEYFKLKEKIIEHMKKTGEYGEFFPSKYSPHGINETRALEQLEFSKEEAMNKGYKWEDEIQETRGKETIQQSDVPDSINEFETFFTEKESRPIFCEECYHEEIV